MATSRFSLVSVARCTFPHPAHANLGGEQDLLTLLRSCDGGDTRGLIVPGEYLETVIAL